MTLANFNNKDLKLPASSTSDSTSHVQSNNNNEGMVAMKRRVFADLVATQDPNKPKIEKFEKLLDKEKKKAKEPLQGPSQSQPQPQQPQQPQHQLHPHSTSTSSPVLTEKQMRDWICQKLGANDLPEDLHQCLHDGVVLCRLLNLVKPGLVKANTNTTHMFAKLDNINKFINGCKTLRLPIAFVPMDVVENKQTPSVLAALESIREKLK